MWTRQTLIIRYSLVSATIVLVTVRLSLQSEQPEFNLKEMQFNLTRFHHHSLVSQIVLVSLRSRKGIKVFTMSNKGAASRPEQQVSPCRPLSQAHLAPYILLRSF